MEVKIQIPEYELREFKNKLNMADKRVRDRARIIVSSSATRIQFNAKLNCPVVSGRLHSSIKIKYSPDQMNAAIGTNVIYADHAHEHARNPSERYFLKFAFETEKPRFLRQLKKLTT